MGCGSASWVVVVRLKHGIGVRLLLGLLFEDRLVFEYILKDTLKAPFCSPSKYSIHFLWVPVYYRENVWRQWIVVEVDKTCSYAWILASGLKQTHLVWLIKPEFLMTEARDCLLFCHWDNIDRLKSKDYITDKSTFLSTWRWLKSAWKGSARQVSVVHESLKRHVPDWSQHSSFEWASMPHPVAPSFQIMNWPGPGLCFQCLWGEKKSLEGTTEEKCWWGCNSGCSGGRRSEVACDFRWDLTGCRSPSCVL